YSRRVQALAVSERLLTTAAEQGVRSRTPRRSDRAHRLARPKTTSNGQIRCRLATRCVRAPTRATTAPECLGESAETGFPGVRRGSSSADALCVRWLFASACGAMLPRSFGRQHLYFAAVRAAEPRCCGAPARGAGGEPQLEHGDQRGGVSGTLPAAELHDRGVVAVGEIAFGQAFRGMVELERAPRAFRVVAEHARVDD